MKAGIFSLCSTSRSTGRENMASRRADSLAWAEAGGELFPDVSDQRWFTAVLQGPGLDIASNAVACAGASASAYGYARHGVGSLMFGQLASWAGLTCSVIHSRRSRMQRVDKILSVATTVAIVVGFGASRYGQLANPTVLSVGICLLVLSVSVKMSVLIGDLCDLCSMAFTDSPVRLDAGAHGNNAL